MASELIDITLAELENMLPFEREIYLMLYTEEVKRVNQERQQRK